MSRFAFTLAAAAVLAVVALVAGTPAHITRASPAADVLPVAVPATQWSTPASLSGCPANPAPRVVFPSDRPNHSSGQGAVIWSATPACPGGPGARISPLGSGDVPGTPSTPHTAAGKPIAPYGQIAASGAPHGQIAIAGRSPTAAGAGLLIQGSADGPFAALSPRDTPAAPLALATAYLGDMAFADPLAGAHAGTALNVHVERFYSHKLTREVSVHALASPMKALTLAMDFRSEVLVVWAQRGAIYARLIPNRGPARALQRLGPAGSDPRISALLSDDNRAIVAWSEQRGSQTSVYIDRSALGVRFHKPQLLERFRDPDTLASPSASPSLVRLSSESVLLAWAGAAAGHWVVRTAPVDLDGVQSVGTIGVPGADALLADLAPGPDDDALVLWTEPMPTRAGQPDMAHQAIFAARGTESGDGHAIFDEPERVAAPGPVGDLTVALDPNSDLAVAAWQGEAATIDYSIRNAGANP